MKRLIVLLFLLLIGVSCLSAKEIESHLSEIESHLSIDYSYQFYFKNAEYDPFYTSGYELNDKIFDGQKQRQSSVVSLSYEGYFNDGDTIGLFLNIGLAIPHKTRIAFNGSAIESTGFALGANFGIGPSFRFPVSAVDFVISPFVSGEYGGNLGSGYSSRNESYAESYVGLGIGLDLRVRFNITKKFYMSLGVVGRVHFLDMAFSATAADAWLDEGYAVSFSIAPVISVGFRFYEKALIF